MPEITAITNPIINSYKRLVPGYEAPIYVTWGQTNRSALIRIPKTSIGNPQATRCELRSPDSSSNPYLAFAATLAAGLEGIKNKLTPPNPIEENIYEFTDKKARRLRIKTIPGSLDEAVKKMERGTIAQAIMGPEAFSKFISAKKSEIASYVPQVTPWEIETYLANY
jgi:glutamine synthetase